MSSGAAIGTIVMACFGLCTSVAQVGIPIWGSYGSLPPQTSEPLYYDKSGQTTLLLIFAHSALNIGPIDLKLIANER
jgi:hypothetical protein